MSGEREGYAPCPTCHQYSHSLGNDAIADAFLHFHTMTAHRVRGHPMGHAFDEKTRDATQVLTAAARLAAQGGAGEEAVERLREALEWYEAQAADCRKITFQGDKARAALDRDGGERARAALAALAAREGRDG